MPIIGGAVILILGGLAGLFFFQNQSLSGKVTSLTTQSASVTAQLVSLKGQLDTSNGLPSQIAELTKTNTELLKELSFIAVPLGFSAAATTTDISGMLSGGGKINYILTTEHGVKVTVINSKDAKVIAALTPLAQSTSTVQLTGVYIPGLPNITVTLVNGAPLLK
jgi:hypothetical protein